MDNLPNDGLLRIFEFLPYPDCIEYELVCSRWRSLLQYYWQQLHKLHFNGISSTSWRSRNFMQKILAKTAGTVREVIFDSVDFGFLDPFKCLCEAEGVILDTLVLKNCVLSNDAALMGIPVLFEKALHLRTVVWESNFVRKPLIRPKVARKLGTCAPPVIPNYAELEKQTAQGISDTIAGNVKRVNRLKLTNLGLPGYYFLELCANLGSNLTHFCFKESRRKLSRSQLIHGLCKLTQLTHLNIGGKGAGKGHVIDLVNDEVVLSLCRNLPQLYSANLEGIKEITSQVLEAFFYTANNLAYLNICDCGKISQNDVFSAIYAGPPRDQFLTIFASNTQLRSCVYPNVEIKAAPEDRLKAAEFVWGGTEAFMTGANSSDSLSRDASEDELGSE